jgi:DNA polymerase-3 subunit delta
LARDSAYLVVGEETFFKDEFIQNIKARFLDTSHTEFNLTSFSAKNPGIDDVLATSRTPPFLGKKRVVVIRDVDKLSPRGKELILTYLKHPSKTTCLVLESSKAMMGNDFLNAVSRYVTVIKAGHLSGQAVGNWIKKNVASYRKSITSDAVDLLRELAGGNLQIVATEIEKIVSFIGDTKEISVGDVEMVVGRSLKEDVFVLVDYISRKDIARALLLKKRLLLQGKRAHEIIGLIGWHLRKALSMKRAFQKGSSREPVVRKLGLRRYYAERFSALLDNFNVQELKEKQKLLCEADRTLKTTATRPEVILDVLLSRLCTT